jgi:hypothetical protein
MALPPSLRGSVVPLSSGFETLTLSAAAWDMFVFRYELGFPHFIAFDDAPGHQQPKEARVVAVVGPPADVSTGSEDLLEGSDLADDIRAEILREWARVQRGFNG